MRRETGLVKTSRGAVQVAMVVAAEVHLFLAGLAPPVARRLAEEAAAAAVLFPPRHFELRSIREENCPRSGAANERPITSQLPHQLSQSHSPPVFVGLPSCPCIRNGRALFSPPKIIKCEGKSSTKEESFLHEVKLRTHNGCASCRHGRKKPFF